MSEKEKKAQKAEKAEPKEEKAPKAAKKEKGEKPAKKGGEKKPFSFDKFWTIWNVVEAVIILAVGIVAIVYGVVYQNQQDTATIVVQKILPYVVGGFVSLDAILRIVMGVNGKGKETNESIMLVGGFELTAGILIMLPKISAIFTSLVMYAISVLMMVMGALLILFSVLIITKKSQKLFVPILEIVFGAILVGVGVTILVLFMKDDNNRIVLLTTGIVFSLVGIAIAAISLITYHKAKAEAKGVADVQLLDTDGKKEGKPEAIEAKPEDVKEAEPKEGK